MRLLLLISSATTPIRPPIRVSIAANRVAASFSPDAALTARKVSNKKLLTIGDRRDGLLSPRQKLRGKSRKLFHLRSVSLRWWRGRPSDRQPSRKEILNCWLALAGAI